jgi:hypothetical protein
MVRRHGENKIFNPQKRDQENAMKKLTLLGVALSAALFAAAPVSLHWSPAKTADPVAR